MSVRILLHFLVALALLAAATPAPAALPAELAGEPMPSLAPMLEQVTPAVVNIHSKTVVRVRSPYADDPFFRQLFGLPNVPQERIKQALGSGVIVDAARGLILTNNHVIEGADDVQVSLADGRTLTAEVIGSDADTDVGVIRVKAEGLVEVPVARSQALRVGDFVVAVGNPFGLGQTVTSGIVSALGRHGLPGLGFQNFIQTDASINPGNSGGALVDTEGRLIGINTAIYSRTGGSLGIGFAIPASTARQVMDQIVATGSVTRGYIGVEPQDVTPELAEAFRLPRKDGAIIAGVMRNGPADRAGVKVGDILVEVDGQSVTNTATMLNVIAQLRPGSTARFRFLRDGDAVELPIRIGKRPRPGAPRE